jgi:hypothetical protein
MPWSAGVEVKLLYLIIAPAHSICGGCLSPAGLCGNLVMRRRGKGASRLGRVSLRDCHSNTLCPPGDEGSSIPRAFQTATLDHRMKIERADVNLTEKVCSCPCLLTQDMQGHSLRL